MTDKTNETTAKAIVRSLCTTAECCSDGMSEANVVDGLFYLANRIDKSSRILGLNDAATPMGAIEALCNEHHEGYQKIGEGLFAIAEAIMYYASLVEGKSSK